MEKCTKCKNYDSVAQGCLYMDADCKSGEMFEPITNYDRIKSMSVEEMAQEFTEIEVVGYECMSLGGFDAWKEYLLQEVSDE